MSRDRLVGSPFVPGRSLLIVLGVEVFQRNASWEKEGQNDKTALKKNKVYIYSDRKSVV